MHSLKYIEFVEVNMSKYTVFSSSMSICACSSFDHGPPLNISWHVVRHLLVHASLVIYK